MNLDGGMDNYLCNLFDFHSFGNANLQQFANLPVIGTPKKAKPLRDREPRLCGATRDRKLLFPCALRALSERSERAV
jgi:hypothetical protein